MALEALHHLSRAVAVIGYDGELILKNRRFEELFSPPFSAGELLELVNACSPAEDASSPPSVTLFKGRMISVETARLAEGLMFTAEDVSTHIAERTRAATEARTDPLTDLGNRLRFHECLAELIPSIDPASPVAVLMLDLDRFKPINDLLGHPVGDALLRVVADRLRSCLGGSDVAVRLGGDEFAIVQVGQAQPQAAAALAERLVDLIGRSYLLEGHVISVGASVGVALIPADGLDYAEIVKNADLALYRAKQGGRGTYRFFEPAMNEQMQARRSLETDLRRALALRELSLVYQPQFNLTSRQVTGFEALLRWHSPTRGVVSPADFIPLAEEIGLIVQMGEWVIRTA